jgi:predicted nucleotidyltransferase
MNNHQRICLSQREHATVRAILEPVRTQLGSIKVFGSRATGRSKPGSDLDVVVFPPAPESVIGDLRLAFEESDLPIRVDVLAWDQIESSRLRDEIARHAVPFFKEPER